MENAYRSVSGPIDNILEELLFRMDVYRVDYVAGEEGRRLKQVLNLVAFDFADAERGARQYLSAWSKDNGGEDLNPAVLAISVVGFERGLFTFLDDVALEKRELWLVMYQLCRDFCVGFEAKCGGREVTEELIKSVEKRLHELGS